MLRPLVEPMHARPVEQLPHEPALSGGVVHEPKVDGYRALLFVSEQGWTRPTETLRQTKSGKSVDPTRRKASGDPRTRRPDLANG